MSWYNPASWGQKVSTTEMQFAPASQWYMQLPSTRFDYASQVTEPMLNSAVAAVVGWVARAFPEAPMEVFEEDADGERSIVNTHPMSELVKRPTDYHSGTLLWMTTVAELLVTGNAYWLKVSNGVGVPVQLWPVPASLIKPKGADQVSSTFIDHYEYSPSGVTMKLDPSEVVHIRHGIDPDNMRKGLSPLASVIREIYTDNEAANYSASLLRNFGVPPVIISPRGGEIIDTETQDEVESRYKKKFSGDNTGNVMVASGDARVDRVGFSPAELDVAAIRQIPEERITAALGIPAAVVGLGTGLETTKVGATLREYREQAWENAIIPMQRLIAEQVENQLREDFRLTPNQSVAFDLRHVRVLQDDQDKLYDRLGKAVAAGWLKVSQAQAAAGLDVDDTQDGYLRNVVNTQLVRSGEDPVQSLAPSSQTGDSDDAEDFEEEVEAAMREAIEAK